MAVTKLEDVKNGSRVSGIVAGQAVEIVSVEWIGEQAINVLAVPAPGALALLGVAGLAGGRRRRAC